MSLTPSSMMDLGTVAPEFDLPDVVSGQLISLDQVRKEHGLVVMFICNHCPYVKHVQDELVRVADEYQKRGIGFVAISSNDVERYPDDSPERMKEQAFNVGFNFPYLFDETQEIAQKYQAACTPDLYLFDRELKCVYRGRLDEATPGNHKPVNGKDLRAAMDALLQGRPVLARQFPSMGCNIKWKE